MTPVAAGDIRWCGALLIGGQIAFLVGAVVWRPAEFQAPVLADALRSVDRRWRSWRWIHAWMAVGVVISTAGLATWTELQRAQGDHLATPIALVVFVAGVVPWVVAMAVRVTVQVWAGSVARRGNMPPVYPSIHELAGVLHGIHMVLSYVAAMVLGLGVLRTGAVPASLGWVGVVGGGGLAVAFGALRVSALGMPFLALAYPCAIGVALVSGGGGAA